MSKSIEPRIALYIRIPQSLDARIDGALLAAIDPARPWSKPSKQDFLVDVINQAVPGGPPNGVKANPRQLDIEDVLGKKAKARKAARKSRSTAKAAKRGKAKRSKSSKGRN